ncbi:MAG TPA: hypothetical protein G4O04_10445 [Anaerolineae bacterium]|nr:hypothetical protein [Anaerolineae bacterium]HID83520.1 hypothetical protein [Anaerolineales bacterium]HIQ08801.1 hypothetical protein [Anaerolineaceae bacterium]
MDVRKARWLWLGALLLAALGACRPSAGAVSPTISGQAPTLPAPQVEVTQRPAPEDALKAFLDAWATGDYAAMYASLTLLSRDAVTEDAFTEYVRNLALEAALQGVDYTLLSTFVGPDTAQVVYRLTWHSSVVGDLTREVTAHFRWEDGVWKIAWDPAMLLPELQGGNNLALYIQMPARGEILDRNGEVLATQQEAMAIGVFPGQIDPEQEDSLLRLLSLVTGIRANYIRDMYADKPPGWYIPIAEVPAETADRYYDQLAGYAGVVLRRYQGRYYPGNSIAPHAVGYVSALQPEEVDEYRRKGYSIGARVGRMGLEAWGEAYLAGKGGGTLYVVDPDGKVFSPLATAEAKPPYAIYSTLDMDLQRQVQLALRTFAGAIVALERDTGRVLALASNPAFDPNAFNPDNFNSQALLQNLLNNPYRPLLNRATVGQYPPGSVFKVITMAAALESERYSADTTYNCGHEFTELPGLTLYDWTYEHDFPPSGLLTLPEGLMRSCNPYFWHVGLDLWRNVSGTAVTDMARAFGLGQPTGIEIEEASGQIVDPPDEREALQQAIGQGKTLVTPLQVANYMAAIGNGGTLHRPQLVERVVDTEGKVVQAFEPQVLNTLPISPENLAIIRQAMWLVTHNPRGTAWRTFSAFSIPVYGKTGTASNPSGTPHAWFAGFTDAQREDKPDIAVAVLVEYGGEGADVAAPIFRRVVEIYFYGRPRTRYPWESAIGITPTPTPEEGTPTPQP